jgi:cobalt-zinc-cadmium efflux system membrane fusion protein
MNFSRLITLLAALTLLQPALAASHSDAAVQSHDAAAENHGHDEEQDEHDSHEDADHDSDEHEEHEDDGAAHADHGHDENDHDENDKEVSVVKLDARQLQLGGIDVAELRRQRVNYELYAPGEIKANGYTSYIVSPRTDSVVIRRHAELGEHVRVGQLLVTLFSDAVTEAQAAFQLSVAEWQRVNRLGRKAVGDKRFIEARTSYEGAQGRLLAFGMSRDAIDAIKTGSPNDLGSYTLTAAINGVVLSDNFRQGQRVEAGDAVMELADEDNLWVEARLSPGSQIKLVAGSEAHVKVSGELFAAVVAQEAHTIDPVTRTRVVRLVVSNAEHRLHPGMFADVYFEFATDRPVLAVPEAALMRSADGDWTVFVETSPGEFTAVEVELGRSLGNLQEVTGIQSGTRVVTRGAFFVSSQAAKGGFDPHNH